MMTNHTTVSRATANFQVIGYRRGFPVTAIQSENGRDRSQLAGNVLYVPSPSIVSLGANNEILVLGVNGEAV